MDFSFLNSTGRLVTLIVIVPTALIALIFLIAGLRGRRKAAASRNWAMTMGKILSSEVEARRSHDSEGGTRTSYYPVVFYEYQVDGRSYRSNKITLGFEVGGAASRAQSKVMQYMPGNQVAVYYNPLNPIEAALEKTSPSSNIFLWAAMFIFFLLLCIGGVMVFAFSSVNGLIQQIMQQLPR